MKDALRSRKKLDVVELEWGVLLDSFFFPGKLIGLRLFGAFFKRKKEKKKEKTFLGGKHYAQAWMRSVSFVHAFNDYLSA